MSKDNNSNTNIDWFSPDLGAPLVSIANYGLTFNKAAVVKMKKPEAIKIGIERDKNLIAVKAVSKNDNYAIKFAERENNGYVRINSKALIRLLRANFDYEFDKTVRFIGHMDEDNGLFLIDLKKPVDISD